MPERRKGQWLERGYFFQPLLADRVALHPTETRRISLRGASPDHEPKHEKWKKRIGLKLDVILNHEVRIWLLIFEIKKRVCCVEISTFSPGLTSLLLAITLQLSSLLLML